MFARTSRVAMIGQASYDRADIEVGTVTSVTRDGKIKAYQPSWGERPLPLRTSVYLHATAYILPKGEWDLPAVMEYCRNRPWSHKPEHKGMPFESLEQSRAELRQFKTAVPA